MKVFQACRLDTVNHCLWRAEERVRLTPRAFDVLRYLVEHAERLVTQDEIFEALWAETYVNPEVIKQYIRGIRKALGDDPEKPSYIETFPRRGYQFIAPVSHESAASSPSFSPKGTNVGVYDLAVFRAIDQVRERLHKADKDLDAAVTLSARIW